MFLHSTRGISRFLSAAVVVAATGCVHHHYEIQMRSEGDQLRRSIIVWRERAHAEEPTLEAFPQDELNAIAPLYGESPPASEARQYQFRGTFRGETPADVGGAGNYTQWRTSLGTLFMYAERFRGDDDLAASLAERRAAAETFGLLLEEWFHAELADDPAFDKLETFLRERLQPDLINLAVYWWTHSAVAATNAVDREEAGQRYAHEFIVRGWRFALERGYFAAEDLPQLRRMVEQQDAGRFLRYVRNLLADRMGIAGADDIERRLAFLADPQAAADSLAEYVESTHDFREYLEEWRRGHAADPNAAPPGPQDFVGDVAARMLGFDLKPNDHLRVVLECRQRPFATNGMWDDADRTVVWTTAMNARDARPAPVLPVVLYAEWSVPNEDVQRRHFGKRVLEGQALGEYCQWRAALDDDEARQWEQFLSSLSPGDNLAGRMEAFRFRPVAAPPAGEDDEHDLADKPRKLILEGLSR